MKTKSLFTRFSFAIAVLLLAACSGGSSNRLAISIGDDFKYSPAALAVKAGQTLPLTFTNESSVAHTLNILKLGEELEHILEEAHDEEALHEEVIFEIHEVAAGESITKNFTAPKEPGDYVIFCSLPGHAEAGAVGTLQVSP